MIYNRLWRYISNKFDIAQMFCYNIISRRCTMPDTVNTYKVNPDNSFTISVEGKDIRLVKESDLLAVKGSSDSTKTQYENQVAQYKTQLEELTRARDTEHQGWLQEKAAREPLETQLKEFAVLKIKAGELETKHNASEKTRGELEEELTGIKRSTFIFTYNADKDKVNAMNLTQLREAEKGLIAAGVKPGARPANNDDGRGGDGVVTIPALESAK